MQFRNNFVRAGFQGISENRKMIRTRKYLTTIFLKFPEVKNLQVFESDQRNNLVDLTKLLNQQNESRDLCRAFRFTTKLELHGGDSTIFCYALLCKQIKTMVLKT